MQLRVVISLIWSGPHQINLITKTTRERTSCSPRTTDADSIDTLNSFNSNQNAFLGNFVVSMIKMGVASQDPKDNLRFQSLMLSSVLRYTVKHVHSYNVLCLESTSKLPSSIPESGPATREAAFS
ncbi:hypothetical protein VNO78_04444 [Psophocarpus tetragonolobus]|uniref:Uncharacterized protein n=1 Tax=Psophocarpus tetragonolobus TaxID=3891 RepID=A0AAN9T1V7_PSOTE